VDLIAIADPAMGPLFGPAHAEPVSAPPKWKLENGKQRPAPETLAQRTKMPEIAGQRPAPASLTRGKINDFHRPGKISQETELRG
jgi:hypothetical protein